MSNELESAASGTALVETESESSALPQSIDDWLKLGGLLYGVGFLVIMVHTSNLNVPAVEALRFQNIIAGWPIGLAMWATYKLRPWLIRPIASGAVSKTAMLILGGALALSLLIVYLGIRYLAGRSFPFYVIVVLASGLFFIINVYWLGYAWQQKNQPGTALFKITCVCSLIIFFVVGYAILVYPHMPQSIGGGQPTQVKLYLKSSELAALLGGAASSDQHGTASATVYLYYRTSDFWLISRDQNYAQPLIQVPMDQVHAVEWRESHSKWKPWTWPWE